MGPGLMTLLTSSATALNGWTKGDMMRDTLVRWSWCSSVTDAHYFTVNPNTMIPRRRLLNEGKRRCPIRAADVFPCHRLPKLDQVSTDETSPLTESDRLSRTRKRGASSSPDGDQIRSGVTFPLRQCGGRFLGWGTAWCERSRRCSAAVGV